MSTEIALALTNARRDGGRLALEDDREGQPRRPIAADAAFYARLCTHALLGRDGTDEEKRAIAEAYTAAYTLIYDVLEARR